MKMNQSIVKEETDMIEETSEQEDEMKINHSIVKEEIAEVNELFENDIIDIPNITFQEDFYIYNPQLGKESGKPSNTGLKRKRSSEQSGLFICYECDYETSVKSSLKRHIQAKHREPQYQCQ